MLAIWSLVAQMVKRLSAMQETRVWSLGREDPLEKEVAIHSSILAWRIPWREEPGRLQSMGWQRVGHDWATSLSLIYLLASWWLEKRNTSKLRELHQAPLPQHAFWDSNGTGWVIPGHKTMDMNLEERQISKQIYSSLTYPKKDISMRKTALVSSRFVIKSSSGGTRCHHNNTEKRNLL